MKELTKVFNYGRVKIRTLAEGEETWFVAQDVCKALQVEFSQTRRLYDDEKGLRSTHTLGGNQKMLYVNEFGLYNLILGSRKPEAKQFKRWVTHEVLPSIRKTGSYSTEGSVTKSPNVKLRVAIIDDANMQTRIHEIKNLLTALSETLNMYNRYLEPEKVDGIHDVLTGMAFSIGTHVYDMTKQKALFKEIYI